MSDNVASQNYIKESGKSIDVLWQLIDVRQRVPHFSILYISEEALNANEDASAKKPLTIKANGEESDSSMPPLVPVSDSEEEVDDTDSSDDSIFSSDDINDDGNDDEAYDTEEEEELKKLFREAMDFKTVVADELDPEETSKSQNPFLKLLGNLKGICYCFLSYQHDGLKVYRSHILTELGIEDGRKDNTND